MSKYEQKSLAKESNSENVVMDIVCSHYNMFALLDDLGEDFDD